MSEPLWTRQDLGMYEMMEESLNRFHPHYLPICNPRRYIPPQGYLNPRYFGISLGGYLVNCERENANRTSIPSATIYMMGYQLIQQRVPTYFIGRDFIEAVAATEHPSDLRLSEIMWPLDTMLLVLPVDFMKRYVGRFAPFLAVGRVKKGSYVFPAEKFGVGDNDFVDVSVETDKFMAVFPTIMGNTPVDYSSAYPMNKTMSEVTNIGAFLDNTFLEPIKVDYLNQAGAQINMVTATDEEDKVYQGKMNALAVKLLMLMTARPNFIESGRVERPAKIKKGRIEQSELWSPNVIGWKYRPPSNPQGGTHASPRLHQRRGHIRMQPYGPGSLERKKIWIEPIWIGLGLKGKEE